ncbi:hypothetical protein IGI37_003008 [Enterococcus sp. AZ194]|uniref:aldo/keto reductase n=1 Tax=Enterococcus sp. AZ194 TaxID=2774629 RepID=UPI003F205F41
MKKRSVNAPTGVLELSQIILGSSDYLKLDQMEKVDRMFSSYVSAGGDTFDTARHYRESEPVIGKWLQGKKRSDYKIITKGCHPVREAPHTARVNPQAIREDLATSLEMLGTSYVDVLLLHRDDPTVPVGPLMQTLNELVKEEKIKSFGVSNWTLSRIQEAVQYCEENQLYPPTFNSPNFSLASVNEARWENSITADEEMIDWHRANDFPLISWSSQAEGFFAHRFSKEDSENPEMKEFVDVYFNESNWKRLELCDAFAKEKGVKPVQIALAYVLEQKFPSFATVGPEEEWQLQDSLDTMKIHLSDEELATLRKGEK